MSLKAEVKKTKANVFRRLYFKRKQTAGYETDWQLIPDEYVKSWGSNTYSINDIKVNFFEMSGQGITVLNTSRYFSDEKDTKSFFFGASTRYGTLCKIEAGFTGTDGTEYPTNTTMFTGYLKQSIKQGPMATLNLSFKPMAAALQEYICRDLSLTLSATNTVDDSGNTTTSYWARNTATELISLVQNYVKGSTTVYDDFIADWQVLDTTKEYLVNTDTIGDMTHWDFITKLAVAENATTYVDRSGVFFFAQRDVGFETTDYPDLNGIGADDKDWGHTIKELTSVYDNIDNVYNYISIKHNEDDTTTSYYKLEESWEYGDRSSTYLYGSRVLEIDNEWIDADQAETIAKELYAEYKNPIKTVELSASFFPGIDLLELANIDYRTPKQGGVDSPVWGAFNWGEDVWRDGGSRYITLDGEQYKIRYISQNIDRFETKLKLTKNSPYFLGGYNTSYYNRNLYGE